MDLSNLIRTVLDLFILAVVAWVILSWVTASSMHPLGRLYAFLDRIIQPIVSPIRRVIPPIRLGGGALDLSPIILIIGLSIVRGLF